MNIPSTIHLNLKALSHNVEIVQELAPKSKILAIVKSNAYGHGLIPIAKALSKKVDALAVNDLLEANLLRQAKIKTPIVILTGFSTPQELKFTSELNCETVIHDLRQLDILNKTTLKKPLSVWLKINTGLNRLGISPQEATLAYQELIKNKQIKRPIKLMTHFIEAEKKRGKTQEQINIFNALTKHLDGEKSLCNSAGILLWKNAHADWVRPGIMLYGASSIPNKTGRDHHLKPVMTLSSHLIATHTLKKGDGIGYGNTWIANKNNMRVGIVEVGYADGYPRHIKPHTPVLINNQLTEIIGRVSMNLLAIDLTKIPRAKIGDRVVLWGEGLPVEKIAAQAETIPHEILARVNAQIEK